MRQKSMASTALTTSRLKVTHPREYLRVVGGWVLTWHGRLARGFVSDMGFQPMIWRRFASSTGGTPVPHEQGCVH
jgi:hypothetical protein